jgi:hypothetical protein
MGKKKERRSGKAGGKRKQYHTYGWKVGSRLGKRLSARVFGPLLARYIRMYDLKLAAEKLLEEATPAGSRLHEAFEWDDVEAAHQYRLTQARHLLRSLAYRFVDGDDVVLIRATEIVSRGLTKPGKYFYTLLKPKDVLQDHGDECCRKVETLAGQLEGLLKVCPQMHTEIPLLARAILQMRDAVGRYRGKP